MMHGWWSCFNEDFNYIFLSCKSRVSAGTEPELHTSSWLWELTALTYAGDVQLKNSRSDEHLSTRSAIMPSTWRWSWGGNAHFIKSFCVLPHAELDKLRFNHAARIICFFADLLGDRWERLVSLSISVHWEARSGECLAWLSWKQWEPITIDPEKKRNIFSTPPKSCLHVSSC